MGLLGQLMSSARKADIGFGIHNNCVILSASNEVRKNKDNEVSKRNCYTKFGQLNEKGDIVGEKEISWFNIDPSSDYAFDNLFTQLEQLDSIISSVLDKKGVSKWEKGIDSLLEDEEYELEDDATPNDAKELLAEIVKSKKDCVKILNGIGDIYAELISKVAGKDCPPVKFKVVYDSKGRYLQQPKYGAFTESAEVSEEDSRLKITKNEAEYKAKALSATPTRSSVTSAKL